MNELDGYVVLTDKDGKETRIPYQAVVEKVSEVDAKVQKDSIKLHNKGETDSETDIFVFGDHDCAEVSIEDYQDLRAVGKGGKIMNRQTISAKEAAEYLGVSYWLVLEMVKRKEVPHVKAGKRILFRKESLDHWMNNKEVLSIQQGNNDQQYGVLRKLRRNYDLRVIFYVKQKIRAGEILLLVFQK
ncbi:helix-turn-helix domain-containing protein [Pseudalkalibacillus sp. A8]|uniref:helix-turn-helix domain-containing protein n=1 Tax=Pseudalkalibacillus sp. A8 TaxID=3382641 RepID=UPI0038B68D9D